MNKEKLNKLIQYIREAENIVFFGGAGVSTESGIPDFRSKDGLYNQHDVQFDKYTPEYLLSRECLFTNPKVFYEFYRQKMDTRTIQPSITHQVLSKMEAAGKLKAVVTQNIDGLHQKAGSKTVYEIHGTTHRNYCARCGKDYDEGYLFDNEYDIPKCECRGLIRPDVTLYGEGLPDEEVVPALAAISTADMLIIGGTSLQVYPANSFVDMFRGKHIILINKEPLSIKLGDEDLVFEENLGDVFREIDKALFNKEES